MHFVSAYRIFFAVEGGGRGRREKKLRASALSTETSNQHFLVSVVRIALVARLRKRCTGLITRTALSYVAAAGLGRQRRWKKHQGVSASTLYRKKDDVVQRHPAVLVRVRGLLIRLRLRRTFKKHELINEGAWLERKQNTSVRKKIPGSNLFAFFYICFYALLLAFRQFSSFFFLTFLAPSVRQHVGSDRVPHAQGESGLPQAVGPSVHRQA